MLFLSRYKNAHKSSDFRPSKRPENTAVLCPKFTGKEKDSETGYYYFGARYYNSDLSIWLSVDPMADKYPSLSPYNYCAWNPMRLVDPNGAEISTHIDQDGNVIAVFNDGDNSVYQHKKMPMGVLLQNINYLNVRQNMAHPVVV